MARKTKQHMKILGNRVLVSKIEEEKKEGFQTVEPMDSFVNKGKVEQVGELDVYEIPDINKGGVNRETKVNVGDTILFAKYSPDTQEIEHEGRKLKLVKVDDILAIL